jgi:hypothetical protein
MHDGQLWWPEPHGQDHLTVATIAAVLAREADIAQAALIRCRVLGQPNSARLLIDVRLDPPAGLPGWRPSLFRLTSLWWTCQRLARRLARRLYGLGTPYVSVACGPLRVTPRPWEILWRDQASRASSWAQLQPVLARPEAVIYRRPGATGSDRRGWPGPAGARAAATQGRDASTIR